MSAGVILVVLRGNVWHRAESEQHAAELAGPDGKVYALRGHRMIDLEELEADECQSES